MVKKERPLTAALMRLLRDPALHAEFMEQTGREKNEVMKAVVAAYHNPRAFSAWKPKERWRSKRKDESARAFIERVYLPLPYGQRPYTHHLSNPETGDRPLYDAFTMLVANNRRLGRTGEPGTLDGAQRISDIFPMVGSERGRKKRVTENEVKSLIAATRISERG